MPATVRVYVPTLWRHLTRQQATISLEARDMAELVEGLGATYPGLKDVLIDERGQIFPYINVFINRGLISPIDNLAIPLNDGDEVTFIPAFAGGGPT